MIGVLLVGGKGSRLFPLTHSVNKHLLPIYNKPIVYYSLSVLLLARVDKIVVVCNPGEVPLFRGLLGDGEQFGCPLFYAEQKTFSGGIVDALESSSFITSNSPALVVLGDNFFFGAGFGAFLRTAVGQFREGAAIFTSIVRDPSAFGVPSYDAQNRVTGILEKPKLHSPHPALTGLYLLDKNWRSRAADVGYSERGEREMADLLNSYSTNPESSHGIEEFRLARGVTWFDLGTFDSIASASHFVQSLEQHGNGLIVGSPHEIALSSGAISSSGLLEALESLTPHSASLGNLGLREDAR